MAQEIPTGYTSYLQPEPGARASQTWNDTIPTNNGNISNDIWPEIPQGILTMSGNWWRGNSLDGHVYGCPVHATCKAKIRAPALFPTVCNSQMIESDYKGFVNVTALEDLVYAPPLAKNVFLMDAAVILDKRESINLITGYATTNGQSCDGFLNLTICTLESGIGEYVRTARESEAQTDTFM